MVPIRSTRLPYCIVLIESLGSMDAALRVRIVVQGDAQKTAPDKLNKLSSVPFLTSLYKMGSCSCDGDAQVMGKRTTFWNGIGHCWNQ